MLRTSTENEKRSAKKNVTEPMKNRGTRRMGSGVPKRGTRRMRSGVPKRGTRSFGEFQMNIFASTLDVNTTLPLAA